MNKPDLLDMFETDDDMVNDDMIVACNHTYCMQEDKTRKFCFMPDLLEDDLFDLEYAHKQAFEPEVSNDYT